MALELGQPAPDFTLPVTGGGMLTLSGLRGRKVVLYFYPKDDTSGCTVEAQDFQRLKTAFAEAGTEIVGVSPDSIKKHDRFRKKYGLDLTLVADETTDTIQAYGLWVEKRMWAHRYMGVERTTLLVDREGKIARIWPKVKVPGHAEEVLAAAKAL